MILHKCRGGDYNMGPEINFAAKMVQANKEIFNKTIMTYEVLSVVILNDNTQRRVVWT